MIILSAPGVALPTPKFKVGQRVIWRHRCFTVQDGDAQRTYYSFDELQDDGYSPELNGVSETWVAGLGLVTERHYPEKWEICNLGIPPEWLYSVEIDEDYDLCSEGWFDESNLIEIEPALENLSAIFQPSIRKIISADLTDIPPVLRPFVMPTNLQFDLTPRSTLKLFTPNKYV